MQFVLIFIRMNANLKLQISFAMLSNTQGSFTIFFTGCSWISLAQEKAMTGMGLLYINKKAYW